MMAAGLATAAMHGCAEQDETLIIEHAIAWPDDGECLVDPESDTIQVRGALDLAFGTSYVLPLAVRNQILPSPPGETNSGVNVSEVQIREAHVRLSLPQAPEILERVATRNPALVEFEDVVPTDSLAGGGVGGVLVEAIPQPTAAALAEEIAEAVDPGTVLTLVVEVVITAERAGTVRGEVGIIESRSFRFPVELCFGCLLSCATCENRECPPQLGNLVGGICGNAQDEPVYPAVCGAEE